MLSINKGSPVACQIYRPWLQNRINKRMNSKWLEVVESGFADSTAVDQQQIQLFDLSMFAIIDVSGTDAAAFLQGQFCNDLGGVTQTHAQITGYCTPKGRLLALPVIVGTQDGFRLLLPAEIAPAFIKRLSMFVMRSAVVINERSDWVCVGITDSHHHTMRQQRPDDLPEGVMSVATSPDNQTIQWHHDSTSGQHKARYIRIAAVEDQVLFWNGCSQMPKRRAPGWRAADIVAGVPSIRQGIEESFVPQMLNLQLIDGLSFTKGCYPGQEIVARMQYLGKLKRHMRLFSMDVENTYDLPDPGSTLSTETDTDVGVVVDAQRTDDGQVMLLAVVKVSANSAKLRISDQDLVAAELPYPLPSLAESGSASESVG